MTSDQSRNISAAIDSSSEEDTSPPSPSSYLEMKPAGVSSRISGHVQGEQAAARPSKRSKIGTLVEEFEDSSPKPRASSSLWTQQAQGDHAAGPSMTRMQGTFIQHQLEVPSTITPSVSTSCSPLELGSSNPITISQGDVAAGPSSSSSTRAPAPCDRYEVFLSFRGEDTRKTFTDHLYTLLTERGVRTFRDDDELPKGELIKQSLDNAIRNSDVLMPIISKSFATSTWCLDELVTIVGCSKPIIPIFYHVEPSDVRKQKGPTFKEAFEEHEKKFSQEKIIEWRNALIQVSGLAGFDVANEEDGHEARVVRMIVKEVMTKANTGYLDVGQNLPGMDMHMQEMMNLIEQGAKEDVLMLGIWGLGGLGKSTLARMIYNKFIHEFNYKSFIMSIRETTNSTGGLVSLQKQLVAEISGETCMDIYIVSQGIEKVKRSLRDKKVLIVLDDVDDVEQLRALARESQWFGPGSRILITTRNKGILVSHKIRSDLIYEPSPLSPSESLILFSHHAFEKDVPDSKYQKFSREIVSMLGGLPLALEVIGSYMFDHRERKAWEEMIDKLQQGPNEKVNQCLKISYDALEKEEQKILVDIACFFIGMDVVDEACYMWDACGFHPTLSLKQLQQKSLLKIDGEDKFQMHDLVRDMIRHSVFLQSGEIGERSHIWKHEEALDVLQNSKGSGQVEGIILQHEEWKEVKLKTSSFKYLSNLRVLSLGGADVEESFTYFPSSKLKWLDWNHYKKEELPDEMDLKEVSVLQLKESASLTRLWAESKVLNNLRFLDLEGCNELRKLPDDLSSCMPLLERLILRECKNLGELPDSICGLTRLEVLDLYGCSSIESLPQDFGDMESLKLLILSDTKITELPTSMRRLAELESLYWIPNLRYDFKNLKMENVVDIITELKQHLVNLALPAKKSVIVKVLRLLDLGLLPQLRSLEFDSIGILTKTPTNKLVKKEQKMVEGSKTTAPILQELMINNPRTFRWGDEEEEVKLDAMPHMPHLLSLELWDCGDLKEIWKPVDDDHEIMDEEADGLSTSPAPSLQRLKLRDCSGLEALPNLPSLKTLDLWHCPKLKELWEANQAPAKLEVLKVEGCSSLIHMVEYSKLHLGKLRELEVDGSLQKYLMDVQPLLPSLERLSIRRWKLNDEEGDHHGGCMLGKIINWLKNLPQLSSLTIREFDSIRSLREQWHELKSLHTLTILRAPNDLEDYSLADRKDEASPPPPPPQLKTLVLYSSNSEAITTSSSTEDTRTNLVQFRGYYHVLRHALFD